MGNPLFFQVSGLRYTYDPDKAIIGNVPITNWPIPSFGSIGSIEKFMGEGSQANNNHNYKALSKDDTELYKVVTDLYITEFFPDPNSILSRTLFSPKTKDGEPISNLEDHVITSDGRPVTVWESLVNYTMVEEDITHYAYNTDRITVDSNVGSITMPVIIIGVIIIAGIALITGIVYLIRSYIKNNC